MSDLYIPKGAKIPNKICILGKKRYGVKKLDLSQKEPVYVGFSSKIDDPPTETIAIVNNLFTGPFTISKIYQSNSDFFARLIIENAIPSNNLKPKLNTNIRHWSLNEVFLSGIVKKHGKIVKDTEFVIVTYGAHNTIIVKDGEIYNKILKL